MPPGPRPPEPSDGVRARRQAQAGVIGLTDVLLGLAVAAIALPAVVGIINQQTRETQDQVAALQLKSLGEATRAYVKDHFSALYAGIYNNSLGGDFLKVSDLAGAGYLSANFAAINPFRQTPVVLFRIVADTSPTCAAKTLAQMPDGVNCKALLEAVVVTTGGVVLDGAHASHIAVSAGAGGGIIVDGGTARGSYGGWCADLGLFGGSAHSASCAPDGRDSRSNALSAPAYGYAAPAAGGLSLGMFFNGGDLISDYLNRFNTGNLEDNTMHTAIIMNGNDITGGGHVAAKDVTLTDAGNVNASQGVYWFGLVSNGDTVAMPTCPGTSAGPSIGLAQSVGSDNDTGGTLAGYQAWATPNGSSGWTVGFRLRTESGWVYPSSTYGKLLAFTKCG